MFWGLNILKKNENKYYLRVKLKNDGVSNEVLLEGYQYH